jgi:hypothetical protein
MLSEKRPMLKEAVAKLQRQEERRNRPMSEEAVAML